MRGIGLIGAGCILAGIFVTGCARSPEERYSKILAEHGNTLSACAQAAPREFNATVDALRRFLDAYPSWHRAAEIQLMIGTLYAQRREFDRARQDLEKVFLYYTQKQELCGRALFLRGLTYENQNSIPEAVKEYAELMKRYPTTVPGLGAPLRIAELYRKAGFAEESLRAYRNAAQHYLRMLEYGPNSPKAGIVLQRLLSAYGGAGQWEGAIPTLRRLADKYPQTNCGGWALYNTAMLYHARFKQPDKAVAALREVIRAYANSGLARQAALDLVRVYAGEGRLDTAREELRGLIRRYPKDSSLCAAGHFALAGGYESAGRWNEALAVHRQLQSAYAGTTACIRSYISVGYHDLQLNKTQQAGQSFDRAVSCGRGIIDTSRDRAQVVEAYKLISTAYSMQRKWPEGIAVLEEFIKKYPDAPETAAALFQVGTIYGTELKNTSKARACFTRLIESSPEDGVVLAAQNMINKMADSSR